ncbi:hypothetical protein ACH5RR_041211 [Cinchona calisaya]|uniref:Uncharacterized protein n=1 Tax=Cinchona calisaya TaxID=153742 RepID=A0ABD2XT77_9GENT
MYGKIEMFLLDGFGQSQVGSTTAGSLRGIVDINATFNDIHIESAEQGNDSEGKEFHDSDYEFHDDDDNVIYEKYGNVDVDENGNIAVNYEIGLERDREGDNVAQYHGKRLTFVMENPRSLDINLDLHIYEGKNIPINEESNSMDSEELLLSSSSDKEVNKTLKPKFKKFRNANMEDLNFCLGIVSTSATMAQDSADSEPAIVQGFAGTTQANSGSAIAAGSMAAALALILNPTLKKKVKCYFFHEIGHNKTTCCSPQAIS